MISSLGFVSRSYLSFRRFRLRGSNRSGVSAILRTTKASSIRMNVPNTLHRSLLSTNAIENSFLNTRCKLGRVTRFRAETDQASRWLLTWTLGHGNVQSLFVLRPLQVSIAPKHSDGVDFGMISHALAKLDKR